MPGQKALGATVFSVPRAIHILQFCKSLAQSGEVPKDSVNNLGTLGFVRNSLGHELELFHCSANQLQHFRLVRNGFSSVVQDGAASRFDQLLGASNGVVRIGIDGLLHPLDLLCQVFGVQINRPRFHGIEGNRTIHRQEAAICELVTIALTSPKETFPISSATP